MRGVPQLTFHGGAETVTGSRYELAAAGQRVLVDCGLFQGLKALRLQNWDGPGFDPRSLDAVLITHAHIDHTGYLPRLVKLGYRGPIYCTPATRELAEIMLLDAARLQEEDADYANRKGYSKHRPALPLFTEYDAKVAIDQLRPVQFGKRLRLGQLSVRFHQAGHILGSSFIAIDLPSEGADHRMVFSGDLGRVDQPLHADPEPLVDCDTLVLEGTYGDRAHSVRPFADEVGEAMRRTLEHGGIVLIPAFAVARAQLVILLLQEMVERGQLPRVPMHMDSPMAVDVSGIYEDHLGSDELDEMPRGRLRMFEGVQLHRSVNESRALNDLKGPRIIISASGMLTGGRVLHHLERLLPDPKNLVVLVGFQAAGTRGRSLQEGHPTVRMHGRDIPVGAKVVQADSLSAHADASELVEWVETANQRPKSIFLVHGEPRGLEALPSGSSRPALTCTSRSSTPATNWCLPAATGARRAGRKGPPVWNAAQAADYCREATMNPVLLTIFMATSGAVLIVRICFLRFRFETVDFALASLAYTLIVAGVFVSAVVGGRSVVAAACNAAFISLGPAIMEIGLAPTRKNIQRQGAQPPSGPTNRGW